MLACRRVCVKGGILEICGALECVVCRSVSVLKNYESTVVKKKNTIIEEERSKGLNTFYKRYIYYG